MDGEQKVASSSKQEDISPVTVNEDEAVPAGAVASDHDEEQNKSPEEDPDEEAIADIAENINEQSTSPEERDGSSESHITSGEEEDDAEDEEPTAASADEEGMKKQEYVELLQELCKQREEALQRNSQLQMKVSEYFSTQPGDFNGLDWDMPVSDQLQEYKDNICTLGDLKQQIVVESESAQRQADELALQCKDKLNTVEHEWQAFLALKKTVAMSELSRSFGTQAAQAKVESILAAEQYQQEQLIKLRLKNLKLNTKVHKLEAALCHRPDEWDPVQVQFKQLQAERLEQKKHAEKQKEQSLKMQQKICSSLELLSNIKEKVFWSQVEVQHKREQLVEVEATLAMKRDLLTKTKQARGSLHKDNMRLKEERGLMGNKVLLRDFKETMDATDHMEEQLGNLKEQYKDIRRECNQMVHNHTDRGKSTFNKTDIKKV